jgi:hypothetical protein
MDYFVRFETPHIEAFPKLVKVNKCISMLYILSNNYTYGIGRICKFTFYLGTETTSFP